MIIGHYMVGIWENGGVASYIRRVSEAQQKDGHTVHHFDHVSRSAPGPADDKRVRYVRDAQDLDQKARALDVDILHVHTLLEGAARAHRLPIIRTVHGHQPYCPSGTRFLKRQGCPCDRNYSLAGCVWGHFIDRCGSIRPRRLVADFGRTRQEMESLRDIPTITVSHFLKRQMVRAGYPEDQIHVLHLPAPEVKNSEPPPRPGVPRFVFLGRITPLKGVEWLLRAAAEARRTCFHLDIAGEGDLEREMRGLAGRLGLADRVTFHGWVGGEEAMKLLSGARALVFPSLWHEPGGTVAFESMVNGRAVIMSRVGGMPEVVHHEVNGLLVEPADTADLARALQRLASDWPLARRLGEAGRRMACESFSLQGHMEALMARYDRCLCR